MPLRVAAISFLNPAPLLYDFEHEPAASLLREKYDLHYTSPAICAQELQTGAADLGLIPIATLTPELAVVPGCTIASLHEVRSILLLVKNPLRLTAAEALQQVRTVAADAASRSSNAYAHVLFQHFLHTQPEFIEHPANPLTMLVHADAALLIGDPALLAREQRTQIDAAVLSSENTPLMWLDLATLWREHTGLPWVAAVWATRPEALAYANISASQLIVDLNTSRDNGLAAIDELVREWTPRIALPPATIRDYLTRNIHYTLDAECIRAIELFRSLAANIGILPAIPHLNFLDAS